MRFDLAGNIVSVYGPNAGKPISVTVDYVWRDNGTRIVPKGKS